MDDFHDRLDRFLSAGADPGEDTRTKGGGTVRSALVFVFAALALALPSAGSAAPPSNDDFASAADISLPFTATTDLEGSTTEVSEPQFCNFKTRSVWYRLAPSSTTPVTIDMSGSSPGVVMTLWRSFGGINNLSFQGCLFGGSTILNAQGGSIYYVQAGDSSGGSAFADLDVSAVPPPQNDAFADAKDVAALPYSDVVPMLAATVETDEPASFLGTAWWAYEASSSGPLLVQGSNCCGEVHIYTGNSLAALEEVAGTRSFDRLIFQAEAGTTYLLQVGHNGNVCCGGLLGLSLSEAPSISTAAMYSPFDPSSYDTVQFSAHVFDPAAFPIESVHWDFGDGGSADAFGPSHRYLADGDYIVTMTARMVDGRTGTSWTTVTVRTHDISITKLVVPQSAQAGKTKTITVEVRAARYDENVTVQLWRSIPGGYEPIGSSVQLVAARRQGTSFTFSYTFRPEDKAVGKVTFKAVASINGARDALPADNEVVALPTKVS